MVGDGSYLMLAQEIITSVQEGYKLNIILLNNNAMQVLVPFQLFRNKGIWHLL